MTIGYSNLPTNYQLILDIPMIEATGTLAHDLSRQAALDKTMTLDGVGPVAWAQWPLSNVTVCSFVPGNPDWIELASASCTDLDFVAGAFSVAAWIYIDDLSANRTLFCRGLLDTDGWYMQVLMNGSLAFYTNQGAAHQISLSAAGDLVVAGWYFVAATRLTTSIRLYINGADVTDTAVAHTNPLTSARDLHIGIYDNETGSPWDGYIYRPRAWGRQVPVAQLRDIFQMERDLFGI